MNYEKPNMELICFSENGELYTDDIVGASGGSGQDKDFGEMFG